MLLLQKITLTQFKNYGLSSFTFNQRVIGICGLNGKGKTNLLDAIHYLCFTKSYFSKNEPLNVQFGADGFRIEGQLIADEKQYKVTAVVRASGKKEFAVNDALYDRFSQHIGKFPCVIIAPDDVEMITGNSEERRKFIDTLLSQTDADYLQQLIIYNKVLLQRNSLLKSFADKGSVDMALLDVLNDQLIFPGQKIHIKRKAFAEDLIPLAAKFYSQIADTNEEINIKLVSQLNQLSFDALLAGSIEKDMMLQRTTTGIHRDDLLMLLDGKPFKLTASQGQRKSLLFALKLAEYEILKEAKGAPFLLLDDVFEKLDDKRMHNLLEWVCAKNSGQVFITDTQKERLKAALEATGITPQIIELN
ncbi:DNA replication and repair protein RecF [soil metagenome]